MNDPGGNSVVLRKAGRQDLDFIPHAEQSAKTDGFVGGWSEAEHRSAVQDADVAYWLVLARSVARPVGYVIVRGLRSEHGSLELKRLVMSETDRGYGHQALRLVKQRAFD